MKRIKVKKQTMAAQSKKDVCCEEKGGNTKIGREMGNSKDTLKEKGLKNREKSVERKKTQREREAKERGCSPKQSFS